MKIQVMSDIHCQFDKFPYLEGAELILVAGDITNRGIGVEYNQVIEWLDQLSDKAPVYYIGGNHDLNHQYYLEGKTRAKHLEERAIVEHDGIKILGLNLTCCYNKPWLGTSWHQMTSNKQYEKAYYSDLPIADIVVSHSPAYGAFDENLAGLNLGSKHLSTYIKDKKPGLVVCGHVHENVGVSPIGCRPFPNTRYMNVATKNHIINYKRSNEQ